MVPKELIEQNAKRVEQIRTETPRAFKDKK